VTVWGALPALLPLALLLDLALRMRFAACRALAFLAGYLACEVLGLLASLALWIAGGTWLGASPARFLDWNFGLQVRWAKALLGLARRIYGLRIESDLAAPRDAPVLVFVRHASLVDALLPTVFVSGRDGTRLRFVMKRELLFDPCLDVVGQRLPNLFIARGAGDAEREEAAIRALARDLGPGEGIVIFPEGTRFGPDKQARALARIAAAGDPERLASARRLRHVLPPRSRGPLALLEVAPHADVLLLAHHGLEGTSRAAAVLRGGLIGRRIRVRSRRVRVADLPAGRAARLAWLDAEWARIDDWLDACERERLG
jgi:1-acyl-sn-glycerol-3-phosphate acyltransferase